MAKREIDRTVRLSVLDRLIDLDQRSRDDPPTSRAQSVRELKISLRRDLEWLLNTRRIPDAAPEALDELRHSVYHYGLPDITSMSGDAANSRNRLPRYIEETIAAFEPRLAGVTVSLVTSDTDERRRELRFIIKATLRLDPNPEHVMFDTVLEIASGEYQVRGETGA